MAFLKHIGGQRATLAPRHMFGRAPRCDTVLTSEGVSGEHAIAWFEDGWMLKDLASRNGSFVDGRRLQPGERVALVPGMELRFGPQSERWTVVDTAPPVASARSADGRTAVAQGGSLFLPPDEPAAVVFSAAGEWWYEADTEQRTVLDQESVDVGGVRWTLALPPLGGRVPETSDLEELKTSLAGTRLVFQVSGDQEHIDMRVETLERSVDMPHRAYHDLLRALAQARERDRADGVPERDQGWTPKELLEQELRVSPSTLTLHVFRARQALGQLGIADSAGLIERRVTSGQLRLGSVRFEVT